MTLPPTNATAATPDAAGPPPSRIVVVVPRGERGVHDYLQRAMASLKDVEVVLDRRAVVLTPADERRRRRAQNSERQLLFCSVVHCPIEPPAAPAPPPAAGTDVGGPRRTLLWPDLRLEHL